MVRRSYRFETALKVTFFLLLICGVMVYYLIQSLDELESKNVSPLSQFTNWTWTVFKEKLITRNQRSQVDILVENLLTEGKISDINIISPWNITIPWFTNRHIHPKSDLQHFGNILHRMTTAKIIRASAGGVGTQIKMLLTLEGNQLALFKPMVVERDFIANATPYAGIDRHNCEIAAFHLNRILDFRRCPLIIGRKINLQTEILPVADVNLKKTFLIRENRTCFYGICHYCRPSEAICADEDNVLEGAMVLWMPHRLQKYKNPWSRTYRKNVLAKWQTNDDYCESIKSYVIYQRGPRLLDLIDAAIFDFLTGNADRHHYEVPRGFYDGVILLLDNGKSFGNPYKDELSILAPLKQCCLIRKSTWDSLQIFSTKDTLSSVMRRILASDPLTPILTEEHLQALDRRLSIVFVEVNKCIRSDGEQIIINDGY